MRSVKRAFLCAGLCLSLLAGCALPLQAPVVPEAGHASQPEAQSGAPVLSQESTGAPPRLIDRFLYRSTPVLDKVVDGVTAVHLESWQREVAVGSGAVELTWQLDTHDARPYRGLLRTEGAEPVQVRTVLGVIQARFEPPLPDQWTAWLDGVAGSHTRLVRYPEPVVTVSYRGPEGAWIPLVGSEAILPAGPLQFQLDFDRPVEAGSLFSWLADLEECTGRPIQADQVGEGRWWLEMEEAPAGICLDMRSVVAVETGLPVARYPIMLWNEDSLPYLERVDLATGRAEQLLRLPPEISEAWPSPDGAWIALRSRQSHGDAWRPDRVSVVDLAGNRVSATPLQGGALTWAAGRLVNRSPAWATEQGWVVWDPGHEGSGGGDQTRGDSAGRGPASGSPGGGVPAGGDPVAGEPVAAASWRLPSGLEATAPDAVAFSPDGRTAAYLGAGDRSDADAAERGWAPLILVDLQTGVLRTVRDFVRGAGKGDAERWLTWSPDGRRIAALDAPGPSDEVYVVVYDLERQERQVVAGPLPVPAVGTRLEWSPRGDCLLAYGAGGPAWVIPLDGGAAFEVPDSGHGQAFWDGTGERILGARGPWEGVFVYSLADGSRVELGDGLPAGWADGAVYVIRRPEVQIRCGPPVP